MFACRLLVLALALAGCGASSMGPDPDPDATFRVLFVGNSLTYANDLPGMVKALADSTGVERTYIETVAFPNFALEDHWAVGDAKAAIARGGWRFVIMQQGPSALPESRVNLLEWAERFAIEIRRAAGVPAMYTVWPSVARSFDFDRVIESYHLAADSIRGMELPAGGAWLAAWRRDPSLALYGPDGFHPSVLGSYVAALTIFGRLYDRPVTGLPRGLTVPGGSFQIPAEVAATLQAAVDEVNGRAVP